MVTRVFAFVDTCRLTHRSAWLSLLKTRGSRMSARLRTDPLLVGHGQVAWNRARDTAVGGWHAPRAGAREPRASAATRRVKGAPAEPRSVQPPAQARVVEAPRVGGLHHEYLRRAAWISGRHRRDHRGRGVEDGYARHHSRASDGTDLCPVDAQLLTSVVPMALVASQVQTACPVSGPRHRAPAGSLRRASPV